MSKFALLFIMVFLGCVIATLTYSGAAAFVLYQLVYFLNPDSRWWSADIPGIRYSFVAAVLMLMALGVKYGDYSKISPWKGQPTFKWLIGLLGLYYLASFWALNDLIHDRFTFDFAKLMVVIFVAYKLVNTERALDASIWAYLIGATYIGYLATITGRNYGDRLEGIGMVDAPDANGVAAALVPAGALLMYYAWMGNWKVKLLCVGCGALIANGLVLINSRGAFLGVVVGAGLYLLHMIFSRYRKKGQRAMAIVIAVAGISGGLYVTDDVFWSRMQTLENLESKESGAGRVTFWLTTFDMLKDYPMGMGVQGYNQVSSLYMDDQTRGGVENRAVHSLWFQGLGEVGPIGFGLFVMALLALRRMSRKAKDLAIELGESTTFFKLLALESALISYLVAGSFIDMFRAEVLYWMILLVAVGSNVYYLQRIEKATHEADAQREKINSLGGAKA
ncbi:O-antigen ligase family protein [Marinobacter sp. AN1]|uniref:O-antigen ligase family protein n=1 Tax=Marinobacter sp. AN1 TaxID=2886046 RepID=UPI0022317A78|nr:O-antigen ligase family protein [Marinobacter sp. AN1]UZD66504.1 O-antigen ligase family protein [Marinobacter sp. AN1]